MIDERTAGVPALPLSAGRVHIERCSACELSEVSIVVQDRATLADADNGDKAIECLAYRYTLASRLAIEGSCAPKVGECVQAEYIDCFETLLDSLDALLVS